MGTVTLRVQLVWVVILFVSGCQDVDRNRLAHCQKLADQKKFEEAAKSCGLLAKQASDAEVVTTAKKLSAEATTKGEEAKKAAAEKARIEAEAAAKAAKEKWLNAPTVLNQKLYKQSMWDVGRGTVTKAFDVITTEIGQPVRSYEAGFGTVLYHVWGADPGSQASTDTIKKAPFAIAMPRVLACGDYVSGMVEFYSYGERVRPKT